MNDEIKEKYYRAGEIAAYARDKGAEKIAPGFSIFELTDYIESIIHNKGAKPAFPVNISRNQIAAHFTPLSSDTQIFQVGDLVKIDVGAHIGRYTLIMARQVGSTGRVISVEPDKEDKNYSPIYSDL